MNQWNLPIFQNVSIMNLKPDEFHKDIKYTILLDSPRSSNAFFVAAMILHVNKQKETSSFDQL